MKNTYRLYGAAAAVMVLLQSAEAFADVLATANRISATAVPAGKVVNVPLRQDNSLIVKFKTTQANQSVVVQYNAECVLNSPSLKGWLHVGIFIDGINIRPTNDNNAMCSGGDLTVVGTGNWVSAVVSGVYPVPTAGLHEVTVKAELKASEPTDKGALDDSLLVVFK